MSTSATSAGHHLSAIDLVDQPIAAPSPVLAHGGPIKSAPPRGAGPQSELRQQPELRQPKTSFERVIFPLHSMFPEYNKVQLTKFVKDIRAQNNGLSGLSIEEIINRTAELILATKQQLKSLQAQREAASKQPHPVLPTSRQTLATSALLENYQEAAPSINQWLKKQPKKWVVTNSSSSTTAIEDEEDPCVICHEEMIMDTLVLSCGHKFHEECIKMWLQEQKTCPTCRNYTLLSDEYPSPK